MEESLSPAYTAGLIDGEGSIFVYRSHASRSIWTMRVSMGLTNRDVLEALQLRWGGALSEHKGQARLGRKRFWTWTLDGEGALILLRAIEPFLIIKAGKARLAIDFQESKPRVDLGLPRAKRAHLRDVRGHNYQRRIRAV